MIQSIVSWLASFFSSIPRLIAVGCGLVWAYLEPTIPYALLCVYAVVIDCFTAWRLNVRVKKNFPDAGADGKLKSSHMAKMIQDLALVWLCIVLATEVDMHLLAHLGNLYLGQYVAAVFIACECVSILENESSCNGSAWARVLQKVLANKMARHIKMSEKELDALLHNKNNNNNNEKSHND